MGEIQIKEGAQVPEKKPKQKAIWWRVLLAFLGGFLFFPLSVVGVGAIFGTVFTTSQIVEMAGGNPDDILGSKYRSQTVLQSVMTLLNEQKYDTLEDLNEISPMVEKIINETINPVLEENIHYTLDWDVLKTMKLSGEGSDSIGEYLKEDITNGIHLVDFIEQSEDLKGVLKYILYDVVKDESGNPIRDGDGNVSVDETNPYSIADMMNGGATFFNNIIDYIKIGDVVNVDSGSPKILQVMSSWSIGNITDKINTLKLGAIFEETDNALINALSDLTINELSNSDILMETVMDLKLGDIITDIQEDTVLYSFKDKTLNEIKSSDINDFYLADLLKKESYILTPGKESEYNKVIAAMIENERKDRFKQDTGLDADENAAAYTAWLEADPENAKYKATVNTLSDPATINKLKLSDILDNSDDSKVIQALFDKGATVGNMSATVNSLTIGEVMEIESGSLLDYPNIKSIPISNSSTLISTIKSTVELNRVIDINESSPQILKTLTDYTGMSGGKPTFGPNGAKIGNISSKLDGMTLGQVITIGEGDSAILKALKDKYVFGTNPDTNLTGAMNNLKFNEVFTWDDCKTNSIMSSLWTNNSDGDFPITGIASAMNNVGLLDVLGDKIYEDPTAESTDPNYHKIIATWWFLLTSEADYDDWDVSTEESRKLPVGASAYNLKTSDFDKLVANMEYHMKNETLDSLAEASLIDMDQDTRDKHLGLTRVGDMTLTDFISGVSTFLTP